MAVLLAQRHDGALREQRVEHLAHLLDLAAAVVAHVNDERGHALLFEGAQRLLELVCHAGMEVFDADVAGFALQHLAPRHFLRDGRALHGERLGFARARLYRHRNIRALLAADGGDDRVRAVLFDREALRAEDVVALDDAGLRRRRVVIDDGDAHRVGRGRDRNADAAARTLAAHAVRLVLVGRDVARPLVAEARHVADRRVIRDICAVYLADILIRRQPVDFAEFSLHRAGFPAEKQRPRAERRPGRQKAQQHHRRERHADFP